MIAAVYQAMADRRILCLESGTGTGKTIGYLWPAIAMVAGHRGESPLRVVISTATHALQAQIVQQDWPLLRRVMPRTGSFPGLTLLKGKSNYLCLDRLAAWQQTAGVGSLPGLTQLLSRARTGERAEFPAMDEQLWQSLQVLPDQCHGRQCPHHQTCFLTIARREASGSGLIVVNHHLYFSDLVSRQQGLPGFIPDHDVVVFDEAHELENTVAEQFGGHLSAAGLSRLFHDTGEYWSHHATVPDPQALLSHLTRQHMLYWETLGRFLPSPSSSFDPAADGFSGMPPRRPLSYLPNLHGHREVESQRAALAVHLRGLQEWFEGCFHDISLPSEARLPAARLAERYATALTLLERFHTPSPGREARWAVWQGKTVTELRMVPLEIAPILQHHLFTSGRAVIFVSATLTVQGGSFDFFRRRMGCPPDTLYQRIRSPFRYDRQAVLYLPPDHPSPNDQDFVSGTLPTVERLLRLTAGRTFLLCTSWAHVQQFYEKLSSLPDFVVLRQGEASPSALLETFRHTPRAVLIGAMTFWQGVDVPGEALSSVIIDRIPFPSPADPVVHFRHHHIRQQGGDPFVEDTLPRALLVLRQGFGRLIRSSADQGIVTLLDPRSQRYREAILSTLPGGLPVYTRWEELLGHVRNWSQVCPGWAEVAPGGHPPSFPPRHAEGLARPPVS